MFGWIHDVQNVYFWYTLKSFREKVIYIITELLNIHNILLLDFYIICKEGKNYFVS